MGIEPTETTERTITATLFARSSVETVDCGSVEEAISAVKDGDAEESKILLNDEVVYHSETNGDIETWEREFRRQKRKRSPEETAWECPHGTEYCYEDDRCIDCQIDRAAGRA
jgi:hypothetical protein